MHARSHCSLSPLSFGIGTGALAQALGTIPAHPIPQKNRASLDLNQLAAEKDDETPFREGRTPLQTVQRLSSLHGGVAVVVWRVDDLNLPPTPYKHRPPRVYLPPRPARAPASPPGAWRQGARHAYQSPAAGSPARRLARGGEGPLPWVDADHPDRSTSLLAPRRVAGHRGEVGIVDRQANGVFKSALKVRFR